MSGWRVWFAFELRPGMTLVSVKNLTHIWQALAESCLDKDGKLRVKEYEHWVTCILDNCHIWGQA